MSKRWIIVGVVIIVITTIIILVNSKSDSAPAAGSNNSKPSDPAQVTGFLVQDTVLQEGITASGTLVAMEEIEIRPEIAGRITFLNIQEGQFVYQGTLLAKLFDADLQAQLRKLQFQYQTAERTEARLKDLLDKNSVSQQEYDNALVQLRGYQADIDLIKAQIQKTEIRAPFSGKVGIKNVSPGAYVTSNDVIANLQQTQQLKLDFFAPEKYAPEIKTGDSIYFEVDGFQKKFSGKIAAIDPKIDEITRSLKIRALVQNTQAQLYPGAFAKVSIKTQKGNTIMVPTNAIVPQARSKQIIVAKAGKATFKEVQTGVRTQSKIQITSGLQPGDTVVTSGILFLKPDAPIQIIKLTQ